MRNWKNKIYLRFIWSYVAVLFAALIAIFFAVNTYTSAVLKSNLLEFARAQTSASLTQFDRAISESRSIALQLTLDVTTAPHLALSNPVGELDILQKLRTMKTASTSISDILLYYQNTDAIFCTDAKRSLRYMSQPSQYAFVKTEQPDSPMLTDFNAAGLSFPVDAADAAHAVAITYGVPYGSAYPYATVSTVLTHQTLQDTFSDMPQNAPYAIFLIAPNGSIFFRSVHGMEESTALSFLEYTRAGESIDRRYQTVTSTSPRSGVQAVLFIDEHALFSSVHTLSRILFLIALGVLLFAVAANMRISRQNVTPLLALREFVLMNDLSDETENPDDPLDLLSGVQQVYSDNQILTEKLALRRSNMLNNVLIDVLTGGNPQALGRRFLSLADMGISLASPAYAVIAVVFEETSIIADRAALLLSEHLETSGYAGRMFPVCREAKDRLSILLLLDGAEGHDVTTALAFLDAAFDACKIPVRLAAGSVESRMEDIPISASRAWALLDTGDETVRLYPNPSTATWQFWRTESQVVRQLISSNAPDKAYDYFCTILNRVEHAYPSSETCLAVAMSLAVNIAEGSLAAAQQEALSDELDSLTRAVSLTELSHSMQSLIDAISSAAYSRRQHEGARILQNIVTYVNENFTHEQLSLELLSRHFNVSIYFISKSFQDAAGTNFNQYLTGLRMDYAKQLLRTTDKTLREITSMIGYVDESSFSRKFKAMFTITPGQYRKQALREREDRS